MYQHLGTIPLLYLRKKSHLREVISVLRILFVNEAVSFLIHEGEGLRINARLIALPVVLPLPPTPGFAPSKGQVPAVRGFPGEQRQTYLLELPDLGLLRIREDIGECLWICSAVFHWPSWCLGDRSPLRQLGENLETSHVLGDLTHRMREL